MHFLVDDNNKIIIGWSPKCGCSHIKNIFWFLRDNERKKKTHSDDFNKLPSDIEKYTTIVICRNPFYRIISGFLEKYKEDGQFRYMWKHNKLTFSEFVNEVTYNNWKMIDRHHFEEQTTGNFDKTILKSKNIQFFDIGNIDYEFIEKLYNKKIPDDVKYRKQGHERKKQTTSYDNCVYDLEMDIYYNYNVDNKYFYNEDIKQKVFDFYKKDFDFFFEAGIDYINIDF
jgi:hypothetical protein